MRKYRCRGEGTSSCVCVGRHSRIHRSSNPLPARRVRAALTAASSRRRAPGGPCPALPGASRQRRADPDRIGRAANPCFGADGCLVIRLVTRVVYLAFPNPYIHPIGCQAFSRSTVHTAGRNDLQQAARLSGAEVPRSGRAHAQSVDLYDDFPSVFPAHRIAGRGCAVRLHARRRLARGRWRCRRARYQPHRPALCQRGAHARRAPGRPHLVCRQPPGRHPLETITLPYGEQVLWPT